MDTSKLKAVEFGISFFKWSLPKATERVKWDGKGDTVHTLEVQMGPFYAIFTEEA